MVLPQLKTPSPTYKDVQVRGSHYLVGGHDDLELEYVEHLPSLVRHPAHTRIISCLQTASLMTGYCSLFVG